MRIFSYLTINQAMEKRSNTHQPKTDAVPAFVVNSKGKLHRISYADPGCYMEELTEDPRLQEHPGTKAFKAELRGVQFSKVWIDEADTERI